MFGAFWPGEVPPNKRKTKFAFRLLGHARILRFERFAQAPCTKLIKTLAGEPIPLREFQRGREHLVFGRGHIDSIYFDIFDISDLF